MKGSAKKLTPLLRVHRIRNSLQKELNIHNKTALKYLERGDIVPVEIYFSGRKKSIETGYIAMNDILKLMGKRAEKRVKAPKTTALNPKQ